MGNNSGDDFFNYFDMLGMMQLIGDRDMDRTIRRMPGVIFSTTVTSRHNEDEEPDRQTEDKAD